MHISRHANRTVSLFTRFQLQDRSSTLLGALSLSCVPSISERDCKISGCPSVHLAFSLIKSVVLRANTCVRDVSLILICLKGIIYCVNVTYFSCMTDFGITCSFAIRSYLFLSFHLYVATMVYPMSFVFKHLYVMTLVNQIIHDYMPKTEFDQLLVRLTDWRFANLIQISPFSVPIYL